MRAVSDDCLNFLDRRGFVIMGNVEFDVPSPVGVVERTDIICLHRIRGISAPCKES